MTPKPKDPQHEEFERIEKIVRESIEQALMSAKNQVRMMGLSTSKMSPVIVRQMAGITGALCGREKNAREQLMMTNMALAALYEGQAVGVVYGG